MIKFLICDIDGTLTDNKVYYSDSNIRIKSFSTIDGRGFYLLKSRSNCQVILASSEKCNANFNRFNDLHMKKLADFYLDNLDDNKKEMVELFLKTQNATFAECAYIGNDTNDKKIIEKIIEDKGIVACPKDANRVIKKIKKMNVMSAYGGQGAVREFVELLLMKGCLYSK